MRHLIKHSFLFGNTKIDPANQLLGWGSKSELLNSARTTKKNDVETASSSWLLSLRNVGLHGWRPRWPTGQI